ncbi:MAG: ISAzo13 family transposase, partial [Planctomycetota bacterium]
MPDAQLVETIHRKYIAILTDLDERGARRWAAAEAIAIGWGGIAVVAKATGMARSTIHTGMAELNSGESAGVGRQRRPGGGRKSREAEQPELREALERLIEPGTRGDPRRALRWTIKSSRVLARELQRQGFQVGSTKVGLMLKALGYSLQANRKTIEGKQHPDRNAQFEFISRRAARQLRSSQPAISVDTKKKEVLGKLKNPGKILRKKGNPIPVETHDFPKKELGKAVPYGVYDLQHNEGFVSVGVSHDTAQFAVTAIEQWWQKLGRKRFPKGNRLLVTADCGGSNNPRTRLWRLELQKFANRTGLIIEVCHYPPGTSKWNKIEHRLFCHITRNWQGRPLETLEVVVNLISNTKTATGLEVHAWLDESNYSPNIKVTDEELSEVRLHPNKFHGEWNYEI